MGMTNAQERYEYLYHSDKAAIRVGDFIEDCNYDPCVVLAVDGDDLTIIRLTGRLKGVTGCCSIRHCGVRRIRKSKIAEYITIQPYMRAILDNIEEVKKDEHWMGWFGEHLPTYEKEIEEANRLKKFLGL